MKVFCWHTESHAGLVDEFLRPSLPTGMELILEVGRQDCASGEFMQDGWRDSMKERCKWWCEVVNCTQEPVLLLDADVQLFNDPRPRMRELLQDLELVGQYDVYTPICCGLMAVKPTPATRRLFLHVWQRFEGFAHDQMALNANLQGVAWQSLPETFWSVGQSNGGQVWKSGQPVDPPQGIIAHHGNFTVGLPDKLELMRETKRIVNER